MRKTKVIVQQGRNWDDLEDASGSAGSQGAGLTVV